MPPPVPKAERGRHCCAVPRDWRDHAAICARFLKDALDRGLQAAYVTDATPLPLARACLRFEGIAVDPLEKEGRLSVVISADTPLRAGAIEPSRLYGAWRAMTQAAVASGHAGLAVVVEMTWALDQPPEALARYESGAAELFATEPLEALCVYDRRSFEPAVLLRAAVGAHRLWAFEGRIELASEAQARRRLGLKL